MRACENVCDIRAKYFFHGGFMWSVGKSRQWRRYTLDGVRLSLPATHDVVAHSIGTPVCGNRQCLALFTIPSTYQNESLPQHIYIQVFGQR